MKPSCERVTITTIHSFDVQSNLIYRYNRYNRLVFSLLSLAWVICILLIVKKRLIDEYNEQNFLETRKFIPEIFIEEANFQQISFRENFVNGIQVKNETNRLEKKMFGNSEKNVLKFDEFCMEVENTDCVAMEREGHNEKGQCPSGRILTVEPSTSLPNALWSYASVWALWRLHNKDAFVPYVPRNIFNTVHVLFNSPSIRSLSSLPIHCLTLKGSQRLSNRDNVTRYLSSPYFSSVILEKSSVRLHDIVNVRTQEFKREFQFSDTILEYSEKTLLKTMKKLQGYDTFENVTLIGMQTQNNNCSGQALPSRKCHLKAVNHMISKHQNIIFLVIGDNYQWCRKILMHSRKKNVECIEFYDTNITNQLVLLAHCNHTIINNEALWAFAALLSGGDTLVCDNFNTSPRESLALQMTEMLYNWQTIPN